MPKRWQT
jgi:hypothetical protein